MQPLFTIATITYNSSRWVRETIESVLASHYTDFEYIISDDCSTDNTWEIVQEYNDPRVRAWRNETNLGEYPNRQKVLERAKGKYIIYIDGDDMLYKDSLQRYFWYLQDYPDVKAIWGINYFENPNFIYPKHLTSEQVIKMSYIKNSGVCFIGLAESLFEVESLKNIGGMKVGFAIGDTYIKKKFACHYGALVIPLGIAYWRHHASQASKRLTQEYNGYIQNFEIDKEILHASYFPLKDQELFISIERWKIRTVKLWVSKTILKGKIADFFKLRSQLNIPLSYLKYLFK